MGNWNGENKNGKTEINGKNEKNLDQNQNINENGGGRKPGPEGVKDHHKILINIFLKFLLFRQ
jgi:hypothetical protein